MFFSRPKIFISYRRDDSREIANKIHDELSKGRNDADVFLDVDDIPYGVPFDEEMFTELGTSDVVLVLIGQKWLTLRPKDQDGNEIEGADPRIFDPADYVHQEVYRALTDRNKLVIPVFVNGAQMPSKEALPSAIDSLPKRNGITIGTDPNDLKPAIKALQSQLIQRPVSLGGITAPLWLASVASIAITGIGVIASILTILSFFNITIPEGPGHVDTVINRLIEVHGNTDCAPLERQLVNSLNNQLNNNEGYNDIQVINLDDTITETATGRVDVYIGCGTTRFTYVSSGSAAGLWELDEITLNDDTTGTVVNISLLLLDYIDIRERSSLIQPIALDSVLDNIQSNDNTDVMARVTVNNTCDISIPERDMPLNSAQAQLRLLGGNSALYSAAPSKHAIARDYYATVIYGHPDYSDRAQIGYAFTLLDELLQDSTPITGSSIEMTAEEFLAAEQTIHCILELVATDSTTDVDTQYLAQITRAIAFNYVLLSSISQDTFTLLDFDDSDENRHDLAIARCDAAAMLQSRVADDLHYLTGYCRGTADVMWRTWLDPENEENIDLTVVARELTVEQTDEIISSTNSWLDVWYWRMYVTFQLDPTPVRCSQNLDVLETRLRDVVPYSTSEATSPLPSTLQLLIFKDQFREFCN